MSGPLTCRSSASAPGIGKLAVSAHCTFKTTTRGIGGAILVVEKYPPFAILLGQF